MEGPRSPSRVEFPKVLEFLDSSLRKDHSWSIQDEYPTALNFNNLNNIKVIFDDQNIVSHAVLKPLIVKTPTVLLKVGAIGSVVTDTQHRNQGLSRQILDNCIESATIQGCDIAILWTNLYDFYGKMGFELSGSELSFTIEKDFPAETGGMKLIESNKVSPEAILKLYNQHSVTTVRTVEEVRKFLNIPQTQVYTAWDSANNLQAYAVVGKGADLNGYVHEWGGGVSKIIPLLSFIRKTQQQPITIIVASHSINLISHLTKIGALRTDGYLGMIKVLNAEQLFNKIKKSAKVLGVPDLVLENNSNEYLVGIGTQVQATDSIQTMVRLIFGPNYSREIFKFNEDTHKSLEKVFPMQFWMWGWDSI